MSSQSYGMTWGGQSRANFAAVGVPQEDSVGSNLTVAL